MNLTQKEKFLLQDQKSQEELCVKKYNNYAVQAQDQQLKQLFTQYAQKEQEHLNSLNQILGGQVPNINQQQQSQQTQQTQQNSQTQGSQTQTSGQTGMTSQNDADLCTDMLTTEKHVSGAYDTTIFEFRDHNIRQVLNHIQKEEQEHGEGLFNYMQSKGMYQPQ